MTVTNFSPSADGIVANSAALYATAVQTPWSDNGSNENGAYLATSDAQYSSVFYVGQAFLRFDTSTIPDDAVVTAVSLNVYANSGSTHNPSVVEVYAFDWASPLTVDSLVDASALDVGDRLAYFNATPSTAGAISFTSEAGFPAAISKTGVTELLVVLQHHRTLTAPGAEEDDGLEFGSLEATEPTERPVLSVTYGVAGIQLYTGGAIGEEDGTEVSDGTGAAPLDLGSVTIPPTGGPNYGEWVPFQIRGTGGATRAGDCAVVPVGASADHVRIAPDTGSNAPDTANAGALGASVVIFDGITGVNKQGWAQAAAIVGDEATVADTSVDLHFPNDPD